MEPFKVHLLQELNPDDLRQRKIFAEWALGKLAEKLLLYRKIVAHFWLSEYVNKQNCRLLSEDQPEILQNLPMHTGKVTIWCGLRGEFSEHFISRSGPVNYRI